MPQNENKSRADGAPSEMVMTANVRKLQNPHAGFDFNQLGSVEEVKYQLQFTKNGWRTFHQLSIWIHQWKCQGLAHRATKIGIRIVLWGCHRSHRSPQQFPKVHETLLKRAAGGSVQSGGVGIWDEMNLALVSLPARLYSSPTSNDLSICRLHRSTCDGSRRVLKRSPYH